MIRFFFPADYPYLNKELLQSVFQSQSRSRHFGPCSCSTLNTCLIILKKNRKYDLHVHCTGTCVRTYFTQFVVSFKKFQNHVLFYQEPEPEPEPAPHKKIPGAGAAPKQLAPKPCLLRATPSLNVSCSISLCFKLKEMHWLSLHSETLYFISGPILS